MLKALTRIFGSRNERLVRGYNRYVRAAAALQDSYKALSDEALRAKTDEFRAQLKSGTPLSDLLPAAFAAVREAAGRTLKMRHFDVQLIGGAVLHDGRIAEMRTGEGKTLMSTLAAYLNALPGEGVHVVTVNEYLAQRDAEWMGPIYRFLGLSVGVIKSQQEHSEKRAAYYCDITYGTNNEFGFDYLRDNLAFRLEDRVQRPLAYAIVDEVDSILIDEARTPLIISGPAEGGTEIYERINELVPKLVRQAPKVSISPEEEEGPGDYSVDEKGKQVHLTEAGHERVEQLMLETGLLREGESLYDAANVRLMHHLNAALRAHALYKRDVEYIVRNGEVIIVDEFTGRTMLGRRWSEGLHQAVEAKEHVRVREENQTVASITFQNYFRIYRKLSGMTGTADTEAPEFLQIYGLEVVVIPTHRPMIRKDNADFVYLTAGDKYNAILEDIKDCVERSQPALVGTTSIETSELLSGLLKQNEIAHEVLNAKQHEREAHIVAQAGRPGAVTIATNMAGRGTDIVLGGNLEVELNGMRAEDGSLDEAAASTACAGWQQRHDQVVASGGLHIVGTERHESRRIDNQLRGRSGRQGDPGSSRFYLSMEDNLMRIFGSPERTKKLLQMAGMKQGEVIESGMLSRQIEKAQRKVESHNFDIRKQLLTFDDVANDQRKVVYGQRTEILAATDLSGSVRGMFGEAIKSVLDGHVAPNSLPSDWDLDSIRGTLQRDFGVDVPVHDWLKAEPELDELKFRERVLAAVLSNYEKERVERYGAPLMRQIEQRLLLGTLDHQWRDHLAAMDYLRQGIHLRGYAQKDYRYEYKREAFEMFSTLLERVKYEVASSLARVEVRTPEQVEREEAERRERLMQALQAQHAEAASALQAQHADDALLSADDNEATALAGGAAATPGATAQPGNRPRAHRPVGAPPAGPLARPQDGEPFVRGDRKVGRNEPCPCGSGRKYKHCHGALAAEG